MKNIIPSFPDSVRKIFLTSTLVCLNLLILSCSNHNVYDYENETPVLDIQQFFNGNIKAWGIVQNWRGKVVNRFEVEMRGTWDGDIGILDEDFVYANGKQQSRQWRFDKEGNSFIGYADDVVGKARIQQSGNALNLNYKLMVPVGEREYQLKFDDWMWLVDDSIVINRAKMKKFGLTVGELIVVMQKQ